MIDLHAWEIEIEIEGVRLEYITILSHIGNANWDPILHPSWGTYISSLSFPFYPLPPISHTSHWERDLWERWRLYVRELEKDTLCQYRVEWVFEQEKLFL